MMVTQKTRQQMKMLVQTLSRVFPNWFDDTDCEFRPATHWAMPDCYIGLLPRGLIELPSRARDWLRRNGCVVQCSDTEHRIIITPIVYVDPPTVCYHATPIDNSEAIRARGIYCGGLARTSTTGRADASDFIHVCLTWRECQAWFNRVFPQYGIAFGKWWEIFEIDMLRFDASVFRDPASRTGYIIEADHIPPCYLKSRFGWEQDAP
jgi:hypothetical protein